MSGSSSELDSELEDALMAQVYYAPSEAHRAGVEIGHGASALVLSTSVVSPDGRAAAGTPGGPARAPRAERRRDAAARRARKDVFTSAAGSGSDDDLMFSRFVADQGDERELARVLDESEGDGCDEGEIDDASYAQAISAITGETSNAASAGVGHGVRHRVRRAMSAGSADIDADADADADAHADVAALRMRQSRYFAGGDPTIKCYRCGESGHRQDACPNESAQRCFQCGRTGHDRRDCPADICFNCGQPGHLSRDCRNPSRPRARGDSTFAAWRRDAEAIELAAARAASLARGTPMVLAPMYCCNCGAGGHTFTECRAPIGGGGNGGAGGWRGGGGAGGGSRETCFRCGQVGHFARDCDMATRGALDRAAHSRRASESTGPGRSWRSEPRERSREAGFGAPSPERTVWRGPRGGRPDEHWAALQSRHGGGGGGGGGGGDSGGRRRR